MSLRACTVRLFRQNGKPVKSEACQTSRWRIIRQYNYALLGFHVSVTVWEARDKIQAAGLSFSFPIWSTPR